VAALLATPMLCTYALAQTIHYDVSFPHIVHHEVRIALSVPDLSRKELLFGMSRSSPGRYATHEYGKNVHDVAAFEYTHRDESETAMLELTGKPRLHVVTYEEAGNPLPTK
jgi:predicted metalloprotease with PDZ domain